jgi:hypothetical protein
MVIETPETNRPYGPPSNVTAVLHRLRSRNLPDRVDAEYLRDAGVSEGTVGRTLFALRFLNLIADDGQPTQALRSIHTSTDEEYRSILSGLIREAYAEVFNVIDPAEDSQDRILNVFRRYTPASQRSRMVIFFLGMCTEAGIPTMDAPRQRAMQEPRPASRTRTTTSPTGQPAQRPPAGSGRSRTPPPPPPPPANVHPALLGLVQSLPAPGQPLNNERRENWIAMARATLTFVYPEQTEPQATAVDEEADSE